MSLKQIKKGLWDSTQLYVKESAKNFTNQFNELSRQLSERYAVDYVPTFDGNGTVSPLEHIGSCMRIALGPLRYYSKTNPYAYVDIDNKERFYNGIMETGRIPVTNDVMRFGVDNELGELNSYFETQS